MKEFFIGCLGVAIFIFVLACFEGWIISLLWNWIAPIFWVSAPVISIWQAIGIMVLINLIGRLIFGSKSN